MEGKKMKKVSLLLMILLLLAGCTSFQSSEVISTDAAGLPRASITATVPDPTEASPLAEAAALAAAVSAPGAWRLKPDPTLRGLFFCPVGGND